MNAAVCERKSGYIRGGGQGLKDHVDGASRHVDADEVWEVEGSGVRAGHFWS